MLSLRTVVIAGVAALCAGVAAAPAAAGASRAVVAPYTELGAWIDVYDRGPWERPERTVRVLARRGVGTVFVQTSSYRLRQAIHRPAALARIVRAAQRRGLRVVGWYLPSFADPARDWRRVRAAVAFGGGRLDGFALDIEATTVRDVATRNRRMLRLSTRLRQLVGERYPLGAITPDPVTQRYWPRFPYAAVRARYDAILPMAYWTFHRRGAASVTRYSRAAVRLIRGRTGDPSVPVHVIGGIADRASAAEVGAFARAALTARAAGASLYDAPITSAAKWRRLRHFTAAR